MVRVVSALQATQDRNTDIAVKMVEHPVNHDIKVNQEIIEWVKEQVKAITQQFTNFKAKIIEFTMSS